MTTIIKLVYFLINRVCLNIDAQVLLAMPSIILAFLAITISSVTLVVVIKQTNYTRDTLHQTSESYETSKTIYQLKNLPKANLIIEVQVSLEKWAEELKNTISLVKNKSANNQDRIKETLKKAPKSPGIINKYLYRIMPDWLSEIWMLGARYYYTAAYNTTHLWNKKTLKLKFDDNDIFIKRFEESLDYLNILQNYLNIIVPDVYLDSPARLSDDKYLKE